MKFFKNNFKLVIGFIIGVILTGGITVYATGYLANDILYKDNKTVSTALDELYILKDNSIQIPRYQVCIVGQNGGFGSYEISTVGYNTFTCESRTRSGIVGTTYWFIIGYDANGTATDILRTTSESNSTETFNISNYNKIKIGVECTAVGGSGWKDYFFNNIVISS